MSSTLRRALLASVLFAALPRCAKDPSGVFVTLSHNVSNVRFVSIQTFNGDDGMSVMRPTDTEGPFELAPGASRTFVVLDTKGYNRVGIQVIGSSDRMPPMNDAVIAYDRAIVTLQDDQMLAVSMTLRAPCQGRVGMVLMGSLCPPEEHCGASNRCESAVVASPRRYTW